MVKKIIKTYVAVVQKIFITVLLFMLYIFGFGIVYFLALFFNRKLLGIGQKMGNTDWIEAAVNELDINECLRES